MRYSRYVVDATNARGAGGLSAPTASSHLDNADQSLAIGNTLVLSSRTFLETRAQFARRRSAGAALGSDRALGQHRRRRDVRHELDQPDRPPERRLSGRQQPLAPARRPRAARRHRLPLQRRPDHLPALGPGQLHVLVARHFPDRRLQQRGLQPDVRHHASSRRPIRISASTCRTNGSCPRRSRSTPALRYDLQWLESITTDDNNLSPRVGVAWTPSESRRTIVRGSAGLFYDRVPLRALANALMSAGNTTDVDRASPVRREPVADAGRSAGISRTSSPPRSRW